jgi:hypothetical protein
MTVLLLMFLSAKVYAEKSARKIVKKNYSAKSEEKSAEN